MPVSRNGSAGSKDRSRWDNLTKQTSRVRLDWDSSQAGGMSTLENFHTIDPAGGVDRGKVVELVRMYVHAEGYVTSGSDDLRVTTGWELTTDNVAKFIDQNDAESSTDYDGITGLNKYVWQDDEDPGTLDVWTQSMYQAFEDETNGTGGGAFLEDYDHTVNFRDEYGITGPIFDQHDTINLHARAFANANAGAEFDVTMHFDWLEWKVEEDLNDRLQPC